MNYLLLLIGAVVLIALYEVLIAPWFRKAPEVVVPTKPFGLFAYEAQGLGRASDDVLRAVVATISFLGHPFTVLEDAEKAKARVQREEAENRGEIADNLDEITNLQTANIKLETQAKAANARASALDVLVAQVSLVVGK